MKKLLKQIKQCEEKQFKIIKDKDLSDLSEKKQKNFSLINLELRQLRYQAYLTLATVGQFRQAAFYFYLAFMTEHPLAQDALEKKAQQMKDDHLDAAPLSLCLFSKKENFLEGLCHLLGMHSDADPQQGLYYLTAAAESGNSNAQSFLGYLYRVGFFVKKDYQLALKWSRLAAKQQNIFAWTNLGLMYHRGHGVKKNIFEALNFFQLAANKGETLSQFWLGKVYYFNKAILQNYQKAFYWFRLAALQGHLPAKCNMGIMYLHGQGVQKDSSRAVACLSEAGLAGHASSLTKLGVMYRNGQGVGKNFSEAFRLFHLAAEKKDGAAFNQLGLCYELGEGVAVNYQQAFSYYQEAVTQKHWDALCHLAGLYFEGKGVVQSEKEGMRYLRRALEKEHDSAKEELLLLEKIQPHAAFHLAMCSAMQERLLALLEQCPYLISELQWELKRSSQNEVTLAFTLELIPALFKRKAWPKKNSIYAVSLLMTYFTYAMENFNLKADDVFFVDSLDISGIDSAVCKNLLFCLTDLWYYLRSHFESEQQSLRMRPLALLVQKIIYQLQVLGHELEDRHLMYQSSLIFIKWICGEAFEPGFTLDISWKQLLRLASLQEQSLSAKKVNSILGVDWVREKTFDHPVELLDKLSDYLKHDEVSAKAPMLQLLSLNLSEKWQACEKSKNQATNMLLLICQEAKEHIEMKKKRANGFFVIRDAEAKELLFLLAENRLSELMHYLQVRMIPAKNAEPWPL